MPYAMRLLVLLGLCADLSRSCSKFTMNNDYRLSGDTLDLGVSPYKFMLITRPTGTRGLRSSKFGYVGFVQKLGSIMQDTLIADGMNAAGLSCDAHTLLGSQHPERNESLDNIDAGYLCQWALEGYGSVAEVKAALSGVNFLYAEDPNFKNQHWALRDAAGEGLVVEFLKGRMKLYDDMNDLGKTGFGILTNEPPFEWHREGLRHLLWKQTLARPAIDMPGSWYPEDRAERMHLIKSAMPQPASYEEAIMQTVMVLNTVTVPVGSQIGTDSGKGEGLGDHTQYGVIYDAKNKIIYWRTQVNQNLQRLRLEDAGLQEGGEEKIIDTQSPKLPWFSDAAAFLSPKSAVSATLVV